MIQWLQTQPSKSNLSYPRLETNVVSVRYKFKKKTQVMYFTYPKKKNNFSYPKEHIRGSLKEN